ncbi:retropepsin-like aspartic protease family protein [Cobetia amphilecti]|uniref:retropepsin-like aspartic protease family protein n=1 Tax=Cobetia amphilecti TaxID=1055104 RepID=UPI0026E2C8A7|nr:retropepsin-like aspartic protease [Cobetia amphilecti]MDO6815929.1 retropepsin-like aspartic protease [Cobetia amphilecti]
MSDSGGGAGGATRRYGVGMLVLCWALILAMLVWWFQGQLDERTRPNASLAGQSLSSGEPLTLSRNRSGHFVAPGTINDQPVTFLLDTGATYVSVSEALAERLQLPRGRDARFTTANGVSHGALTTLDTVSLAGLSQREVRGAIVPGMHDEVGLLGMSFLGEFDINMRGQQMTLTPVEGAGGGR